jgi:glycosyltransferase involved in cell wall biosynthesis
MRLTPPLDWDEARYLAENPDVREAIRRNPSDPLTGYDHYVRFGLLEGRHPVWLNGRTGSSSEFEAEVTAYSERFGFPKWAISELAEHASIEPALDHRLLPDIPLYNPFNKDLWGKQLLNLCGDLRQRSYDYLFFAPWIRRGGADLATILHIRAAFEASRKVAVVLTENAESDWLDRLPPGVDVLHFGKFFASIPLDHQANCCYILVLVTAARKVHVINSHAAWKLLIERSAALSRICDLYVSLYCYDYMPSGEPVGYARDIRRCAADISQIFTDNSLFAIHLHREIGVPQEKIAILWHPVLELLDLPNPPLHSKRILWASRLDPQKRPDLLVQIAQRLSYLTFDVFGSAVMGGGSEYLTERFRLCPNIEYHGAFDKISQVVTGQHRLFLYTSAWDGLPNVVLEALHAGMLVVAAKVGGIGYDLSDSHCFIVNEHHNPDAYVRAIQSVYSDPETSESVRLAGKDFIRKKHTLPQYISQLTSSGYLSLKAPVLNTHPSLAFRHWDRRSP